jgi:hypothetical protein
MRRKVVRVAQQTELVHGRGTHTVNLQCSALAEFGREEFARHIPPLLTVFENCAALFSCLSFLNELRRELEGRITHWLPRSPGSE